MITRLILGIYFVEAGLLLAVAPWTIWWQRNYFAARAPWLATAMNTFGVQGLVVFVGIVTTLAGMAELRTALSDRWTRSAGRRADG